MTFGIMSCVYTYKDDRKRGRGDSLNQEGAESTEGTRSVPEPESLGEKDPLLEEAGSRDIDNSQPTTLASSDM